MQDRIEMSDVRQQLTMTTAISARFHRDSRQYRKNWGSEALRLSSTAAMRMRLRGRPIPTSRIKTRTEILCRVHPITNIARSWGEMGY